MYIVFCKALFDNLQKKFLFSFAYINLCIFMNISRMYSEIIANIILYVIRKVTKRLSFRPCTREKSRIR